MQVKLYNAKLAPDLSVLHYWGTASARDSWLAKNVGNLGTVSFSCNLLFPDDGGFFQIPTNTPISDACTYAVFDNGAESRCYFVREVNNTARGAATLRLELDAWGTWYSAGHINDIVDPHIITGHGYVTGNNDFAMPLVSPLSAKGTTHDKEDRIPLFSTSEKNCFPVAIYATNNRYIMAIRSDNATDITAGAQTYNLALYYALCMASGDQLEEGTEGGRKYAVAPMGVWILPADIIIPLWQQYYKDQYDWRITSGGTALTAKLYLSNPFPDMISTSGAQCISTFTKTVPIPKGKLANLKIGSKMIEYRDLGAGATVQITASLYNSGISIWAHTPSEAIDITDEYVLQVYTDTAQSYLAQNKAAIGIGMVSSAVTLVGSLATGNVAGIIGGGLSLASSFGQIYDRFHQPCKADGVPSALYTCADNGDAFGAWYFSPAVNQRACINAIKRYGYSVDVMPTTQSWITDKPTVENITLTGTVTGYEEQNFRYVQIDRATFLAPGYAVIAAERLRQRFLEGVTIRYD